MLRYCKPKNGNPGRLGMFRSASLSLIRLQFHNTKMYEDVR